MNKQRTVEEVEVAEAKMDEMDKAAAEAQKEYNVAGTASDTAWWIEKWYKTAGYKRLVRIIRASHRDVDN